MAQRPTNASQSADQSATSGFRPVGGLIYGIIAFIVSFIVTTVYFFYRANEFTNGNIDRILPEEPEAFGWPFYNANRVDIAFSPGSESINYIESFEPLNMLIFNLILIVFLFLAGYSVATRTNASLSDEASFVAGASVAVGYVPLLVLGTFAFEVSEAGATAGPELGGSLLIFGTLFAAGAGGVGGFLGG